VSTEPRTVTVNVFVTKPLEIDEPEWCAGHPDERAGYKVDITHYGPEHTITAPSGEELFRAMLSQSPFSGVDRTIGLYVETGDFTGTRTPDEVEQLADAFVQAAEQLRALGQELAEVLGGESR
jgi:hypothetical protein